MCQVLPWRSNTVWAGEAETTWGGGWLREGFKEEVTPAHSPWLQYQIIGVWKVSESRAHVAIQFSSVARSCPTLCDPMNRSTSGLPVHHQLPESTQTHVHRVSDAIQPSHPLSPLLLLPSIIPSIRVFSNESTLHIRWPKYWSFNFNISPSNEHPGLISFRVDWLDLLSVQGTLKSLLQHHSSKASILHSAFFIVQLSHPYVTTGKTIALAIKFLSLIFLWCFYVLRENYIRKRKATSQGSRSPFLMRELRGQQLGFLFPYHFSLPGLLGINKLMLKEL